MNGRYTRWIRYLLLAVVVYLLVRHVVGSSEDYQFVANLDWRYLLPVIALSVGNILLDALRHVITAQHLGKRLPLKLAFVYLVVARFLNKFVPQSGVAYKAHVLRKAGGFGAGELLTGFGSMVWVQLMVSLLLALIVVWSVRPSLAIHGVSILALLLAGVVVLIVSTVGVVFIAAKIESSQVRRETWGRRLMLRLARLVRSLLRLIRDPALFTLSSGIIVVATLVSLLRLYLCFRMIGVEAELVLLVLFVTLNRALTIFTITPGNLGVTEFLFGLLAQGVGIGMAQGVMAALIIRLVTFAVLALLGAIFLVTARHAVFGDEPPATR